MKKGFTMVELLVVLLIIGILAAIATPLYLQHVKRSKASEAVAAMALIRQGEREYKTRVGAYLPVTNLATLGNQPTDPTPGLGVDMTTAQYFSAGSYTVTTNANGASGQLGWPATCGTIPSGAGNAVDFVIIANGANSTVLAQANTFPTTDPGAANYQEVNGTKAGPFVLCMDNSGRIFVDYDGTTGGKLPEAY